MHIVLNHRGEYLSLWPAIESIAGRAGCTVQSLRNWERKYVIDTGMRDRILSEERTCLQLQGAKRRKYAMNN